MYFVSFSVNGLRAGSAGLEGRGFGDRNALITRTRQSLIEVVKRGMPQNMRRNANGERSGDQIRGKSKAQGKWEHGTWSDMDLDVAATLHLDIATMLPPQLSAN